MAGNVKNMGLTSLDDLFKSEEERQQDSRERILNIPIEELHPYARQPYSVERPTPDLVRLMDSIEQVGIAEPLIVRPRTEGGYEILSGHRRDYCARVVGLQTLPVIVREYTDDEADILVVDYNITREDLLPSEKAKAYSLKLEAIVTEIKAPDGYILQDTPKTFEIKDGGSMELVFTNKKAYGLQIRKIVKDTGEALPGAKFRVEKATGELIGEYTSNSSGLVTVSGLEDGVYVVTEIKAPDGYRLDSTPQNVIVKAGELTTVTFENAQLSSVRIRKIDAVTREPIGGVRFLIKDEHNNVIGEYTTDSDGYIELEDDLEEGKYYAEEIEAAPGYIRDEEVKTFRVKRGETTEIVWENTPQQGQIQITKKSKDDNPINGLPAGTLLQGATFEIYDKAGNVVDTIVSNERGVAVSKLLPLGRYTIKETKAPAYYGASGETFEAEIEFSGQIVRLEVLNESVYTNVSIAKSGPKQVVPGQPIRWTVTNIANNSTVSLQSFYWRDTLPYQAVTLDKIVTGTYNARLSYKIVYRTNYNQNYRTLADNLSTAQNRTIQANPTALGLKSGEVVTDFMFVFGNVPAGFRCVETPYVYGNVRSSVAGTAFVNKADVGGLHNQQWIMSNDAWTTTIYRVTKPVLPQTGW